MSIPLTIEGRGERPERPNIVVVSGPSGAGKGTVVGRVMEAMMYDDPERRLSRSWTTRDRRPTESVDAYTFVNRETFMKKVESNGFLEWTEFGDDCYGTPSLEEDERVMLEIEVKGARQVRRTAEKIGVLSSCQFIYILPPTPSHLWDRLVGRDDDTKLARKIGRFAAFVEYEFDIARQLGAHVVVNQDVDYAAANIISAINGEYWCPPDLVELIDIYQTEAPKLLDSVRIVSDQ